VKDEKIAQTLVSFVPQNPKTTEMKIPIDIEQF
jgi:hypothetical protein